MPDGIEVTKQALDLWIFWAINHKRGYRKILLFTSKAHIIKEKEASL